MNATNRIVFNTLVQYLRSFIALFLSLLTTRYVMQALGHDGFGVYSLIGSVITLLGFITLSLAGSTQRFLSHAHGQDDPDVLRAIFGNSLVLHLGIVLLLLTVMTLAEGSIMRRMEIPPHLFEAAVFVYYSVLVMVLLSFVTAPVRALFIARENIVFVSVVEILDAVLKFVGALFLPLAGTDTDSLRWYALLVTSLSVFNFVVYGTYALWRYPECHLPHWREISLQQLRQLGGFAIWNIYSVGSGVLRTQGFAVLINQFFGTLLNAAYGIALQVNNAVSFVVMSILNAINPQLMKAEGAGDRPRMLMLATQESKYSLLVLLWLFIPLIFEMPAVLDFWLKDVPPSAVMFARYILIAFILDQATIGLASANQAIGKIRNYSLLINTTRLLELPAAYLCLRKGLPPVSMMGVYLLFEMIIGAMRIPYLQRTAGLQVPHYLREVFLRCLPLLVESMALATLMTTCVPPHPFRFLLTQAVCMVGGLLLIYWVVLTAPERAWVVHLVSKLKKKCL